MKISLPIVLITLAVVGCSAAFAYEAPIPPYAPAVGENGTTAIGADDIHIQSWATSVHSVNFGADVAEEWKNPEASLGPAESGGMDVTVLGRGGQITLSFAVPIMNGDGNDFAIFENSFSDTFLELAFVEVSTDGEHFVRFPNYSLTDAPVPGFGDISPTLVHGYAGKYKAGYGVPFDLDELAAVYSAIESGYSDFSGEFSDSFVANFPYLDLNEIPYVRLIDIPGDGSAKDCEGYPIYDPYKTVITAGFDLDAVGVLNQGVEAKETFAEWSTAYNLDSNPEADSDKDGWGQYLEYYFGTNPKDSNDIPEVRVHVKEDGGFVLTYWRRNLADTDPQLMTSTDGSTWDPFNMDDAIQVTETKVISNILFVLETVTIPVAGDSLFVRFLQPPITAL